MIRRVFDARENGVNCFIDNCFIKIYFPEFAGPLLHGSQLPVLIPHHPCISMRTEAQGTDANENCFFLFLCAMNYS